MNILVIDRPTPMFGPRVIGEWLERSEGHKVETVLHPSDLAARVTPRWPWTKWQQIRGLHRYIEESHFDAVICADPAAVAAMRKPRKEGWIDKIIYWRMDYSPPVKMNLGSMAYQRADRKALKSDEVWSVARLDDARVEASFEGCDTTVRHVPYLLPPGSGNSNGARRERNAIWIGPDRDGSRKLAKACAMAANCEFIIADYTDPLTMRTEADLFHELSRAVVAVLPYKPAARSPFYYADPSRIKWALAYGIPIVTTKVVPFWRELEETGAGVVVEYRRRDITAATELVLNEFEERSQAARELASKYVVSDTWIKINGR